MSAHPSQRRSFWTPNEPPQLPSINEMFPEHFMKYSRNGRFVLNQDDPEGPSRSSKGHYSESSQYFPPPSLVPSTATASSSRPRKEPPNRPPALFPSEKVTSEKKHMCPTCSKCFSRPSSLRIHFNTHTGETPFRCPFPRCGREFNVNSNMRRHYRNHAGAGGFYHPVWLYDVGISTSGLEISHPLSPSPLLLPGQGKASWTSASGSRSQMNDPAPTLSHNRMLDASRKWGGSP